MNTFWYKHAHRKSHPCQDRVRMNGPFFNLLFYKKKMLNTFYLFCKMPLFEKRGIRISLDTRQLVSNNKNQRRLEAKQTLLTTNMKKIKNPLRRDGGEENKQRETTYNL